MRKWMAVAMIALGALTVTGVADAKKPKKEKKAKAPKGQEPLEIQMTDVETLDTLFKKAATPVDKINTANQALIKGRKDLNTAMGLSEDSAFIDALVELKTKAGPALKFAKGDGKMPQLNVDASAGDDVKNGVDAVNGLVKASASAIKDLASLPKDMQALITEATAFANMAKLKEIAVGMPPTKIPGILGKIKKNISTLGKAVGAVKDITTTSTGIVADVTKTFGS